MTFHTLKTDTAPVAGTIRWDSVIFVHFEGSKTLRNTNPNSKVTASHSQQQGEKNGKQANPMGAKIRDDTTTPALERDRPRPAASENEGEGDNNQTALAADSAAANNDEAGINRFLYVKICDETAKPIATMSTSGTHAHLDRRCFPWYVRRDVHLVTFRMRHRENLHRKKRAKIDLPHNVKPSVL